jgi:hypothetical protein
MIERVPKCPIPWSIRLAELSIERGGCRRVEGSCACNGITARTRGTIEKRATAIRLAEADADAARPPKTVVVASVINWLG